MKVYNQQDIRFLSRVSKFLIRLEKANPKLEVEGQFIYEAINDLAGLVELDPSRLREAVLIAPAKPGDDRHG